MFANVPRMSTSWFPRRVPYWLKSTGFTPFETRYCPAGLAAGIAPAGEMWSVVTESPTDTRTRAPTMSDPRWRCRGEVLEERRLLHVCRARVPRVGETRRRRHRLPEPVALEDLAVFGRIHLLRDRLAHQFVH